MNLLITGGTGFFGKSLLRRLQAASRSGQGPFTTVTVLSRDPARFLARHPEFAGQDWLQFHQGDISAPATLPHGAHYSHVLHAAADSTDGARMSDLQRYDQIVGGTRNLLDFAVACGAQRFLLTSSGGVYGRQPAGLAALPEDSHTMPDPLVCANAYGVAKRAAEHLCALYAQQHGLHTVIARCFAFVGPDLPLDAHFAIGNFIRDALTQPAITVAGDGTPLRSYLDQDDLADWLLTLIQAGRSGQAYNVGSDQAISIADLAHLVAAVAAPGKPVRILGVPDSRADRNRYLPDISKARQELGLAVRIDLNSAIARSAAAARETLGAPHGQQETGLC